MYARKIGNSPPLEIPEMNESSGFDLMIGDWVAPHGKGKTSDLVFTLKELVPFTTATKPFDYTLTVSICMVLTLLFWLLAFLNRQEKNLSLFAICASLFLVTFFCKVHSENPFISFNTFLLSFKSFEFLSSLSNCLTLFIVAKVFKGKAAGWLKIIIVLLFVLGAVNVFVTDKSMAALSTLVPVFVYLWYIFSSRKTLKGAQWAIVFGLLLFSLLVFVYVVMLTIYQTDFVPYNMLIASGLILAFPLSLLVYVALRFKEIVSEVRLQAAQVVRLSEEKKEQALRQQKLLEEEVARQTIELRTSLENLKSTQKQLDSDHSLLRSLTRI